jgi:hypothetical protein
MTNTTVFPLAAKSALTLTIVAALLAGCGGGGGGGEASVAPATTTSPNTTTAGASAIAAVKPGKGDWLMYTHDVTVYRNGTGTVLPQSHLTRTFNEVNSDGTITYTETSSDTGLTFTPKSVTSLDATGATTRYVTDSGQTCTFAPAFAGVATSSPGFERVAGSYAQGTQWNASAQSTCQTLNSSPFNGTVNNTGSIVADETIVVRGLQYSVVKEVYSTTSTPGANAGSLVPTRTDYTCWRDKAKSRVVKCIIGHLTQDTSGNYRLEYSSTLELAGYSLVNAAPKQPQAVPYSGNWTLSYTGTASGSCPGIRVNTAGAVYGDCTIGGATTVNGIAKQNGEIEFKVGSNVIFTGRLSSPLEGSGTWTNTAGGNGVWTMSHR